MDDIEPYSARALHFIGLSLQVHLEQMEERIRELKAVDEDLHEDELADLLNDSHYLKILVGVTRRKHDRLVESLGNEPPTP